MWCRNDKLVYLNLKYVCTLHIKVKSEEKVKVPSWLPVEKLRMLLLPSFLPSSSFLLTHFPCVLSRIFQSEFAHTWTVGLVPLRLWLMTEAKLGRGHFYSEQRWCRWTVWICVCICVCVSTLVTLLSRLQYFYTDALHLSNVGAVIS